MSGHDYVKIQIIITYVPEGKFWQSGLLQRTHILELPIETLDIDKLTNFIQTNIKEIHELQTANQER
jgi:hypothetical protein